LSPAPDSSMSDLPALSIPAPILCYVTDRQSLAPGDSDVCVDLLKKIRASIAARMNWIQIREKDLLAPELLALVREAVYATESQNNPEAAGSLRSEHTRTKIIVNDRLDVAIAASAAGVHLGRESAPVREVAPWCRNGNAPQEFIIGASCHSLAESCAAESAGASYVILGPVFDTPSKRAFGPPVGIAQLSAICATVKIPVLAIGGIDAENAGECLRAGAAGIAAIRLFQDAGDEKKLVSAVRSLRDYPAGSARR
jgi:thiamine-phosphate pyrophosphorylase